MEQRRLAPDVLWEAAAAQHGFVTAGQAIDLGITRRSVNQLVYRGTLERASLGVYRFAKYPASFADPYMLAVLWTRAEEAALSHETALDVYGVCDVNPGVIHITVGAHRRIRRLNSAQYVIHRQDFDGRQFTWWEEVRIVTLATAIRQCLDVGTPTYLLRQAVQNGHSEGRLATADRDVLSAAIDADRG